MDTAVETYANKLYLGHTCHRYWVHPRVMVGGSILDAADWKHLQKDFRLTAVLNVETEHSDHGKEISNLLQTQVPDDGTPFPLDALQLASRFSTYVLGQHPGAKIYVHCQMGGSRSPAFAYLVMRSALNMTPDQSLGVVRKHKPDYGHHQYHQNYLGSIEKFLSND